MYLFYTLEIIIHFKKGVCITDNHFIIYIQNNIINGQMQGGILWYIKPDWKTIM